MTQQDYLNEVTADEIREQYFGMAIPGGISPEYRADYAATMARFASSAGTFSLRSGDSHSAVQMYKEAIADLEKAIDFAKEQKQQ